MRWAGGCIYGGVLLLSACSMLPSAEDVHAFHAGLLSESSTQVADKGVRVQVAGSATAFGADLDQEFAHATHAAADQQHCAHFRVDEETRTQENTLVGTRQVLAGIVRCY